MHRMGKRVAVRLYRLLRGGDQACYGAAFVEAGSREERSAVAGRKQVQRLGIVQYVSRHFRLRSEAHRCA